MQRFVFKYKILNKNYDFKFSVCCVLFGYADAWNFQEDLTVKVADSMRYFAAYEQQRILQKKQVNSVILQTA